MAKKYSAWLPLGHSWLLLLILATSWFAVACELHRDWRNDVEGLAKLFANHLPAYRNLILSHHAKR